MLIEEKNKGRAKSISIALTDLGESFLIQKWGWGVVITVSFFLLLFLSF